MPARSAERGRAPGALHVVATAAVVVALAAWLYSIREPVLRWWRERDLYDVHAVLEVADPSARDDVILATLGRLRNHLNMGAASAADARAIDGRHVEVRTAGLSPEDLARALDEANPIADRSFEAAFEAFPGDASRIVPVRGGGEMPLLEEPVVTSDHIVGTFIRIAEPGDPSVHVRFDDEGAERMAEATRRGVGRRLALVVNGTVVMAPTIQTPIVDGRATIAGNFTRAEAAGLAAAIAARPYPCDVTIVDVGRIR